MYLLCYKTNISHNFARKKTIQMTSKKLEYFIQVTTPLETFERSEGGEG